MKVNPHTGVLQVDWEAVKKEEERGYAEIANKLSTAQLRVLEHFAGDVMQKSTIESLVKRGLLQWFTHADFLPGSVVKITGLGHAVLRQFRKLTKEA
jgi:hypothetical protein